MDEMNESMRRLERQSRKAFDASVESMDGSARSKLARMRATALADLKHRRRGAAIWIPAGAVAAALAAAVLWPRGDTVPRRSPESAVVALEDFEIVAGGEDFDLLTEDADFVAWAAAQSDDVG